MIRITCDVVRDLIPLYVDDVLSEDSRKIVEEHINECTDCKKYCSNLKEGTMQLSEKSRHDQEMIKSISREISRKRTMAVALAVVIVVFIAAAVLFGTVDGMRQEMVSGEFSAESSVSADIIELHNKEIELKKQIFALDKDNFVDIRVDMAGDGINDIDEASICIVSKTAVDDIEMKNRIKEIAARCLEVEAANIEVMYAVAE